MSSASTAGAADAVVRYRVGRADGTEAAALETRGFFRDRVPYAVAVTGRTYVDTVTIIDLGV